MRKAIQIKVTLWIEGEDAPAHDWARYTMRAVRAMIATGARRYPHLDVTIKRIEEDRSLDEDEWEDEDQPDPDEPPATDGTINTSAP